MISYWYGGFGAPIGALIDMHIHIENLCIYRLYMYYICMYRGIDVSQVKYVRIENVCIYRRVDSTESTMYRGIYVSQVKYARIENVCIYRRADYTGITIYV